jgi:hypothetical protein
MPLADGPRDGPACGRVGRKQVSSYEFQHKRYKHELGRRAFGTSGAPERSCRA